MAIRIQGKNGIYAVLIKRQKKFLFQQYSKPMHLIRNVYVQTLLNCYLLPFSVNTVQISLNCTEGCGGSRVSCGRRAERKYFRAP